MQEMIVPLAAGIVNATEEDALLSALCAAAERTWAGRLKDNVSVEDCADVFCCAAAFTAAADYLVSQGGSQVRSFTAGDLSITSGTDNHGISMVQALRQTAERLMAPYAVSDCFAFRGVRG